MPIFENKLAPNFDIATKSTLSTGTNSLDRCSFNNPVCSLNNSTISDSVWSADGMTLFYIVLWLSTVLHYSWTVIRLIALHWKEGWTKPPP